MTELRCYICIAETGRARLRLLESNMLDRRMHCITKAFKTAVSLTRLDLNVLAARCSARWLQICRFFTAKWYIPRLNARSSGCCKIVFLETEAVI